MHESGGGPGTQDRTRVARTSDQDLVVTRRFDAPVGRVFAAWTDPEQFMRWWAPRSMGVPLLSCAMDVRTGGGYRLEFGNDPAQTRAFFGVYRDVQPESRLVWTNDEGGEGTDGPLTTVTFVEQDGTTLLTLHERHPSKEALDEAMPGMEGMMPEQFAQLDELLAGAGERLGDSPDRR